MLVLPFSPSTSHKFYPCQTNFYIWNILKVLTYDLQITWLFKMEFKTLKSKCIFHPDYPCNLDIYMEASIWRKCISDKSEGLSNNNNKTTKFLTFQSQGIRPTKFNFIFLNDPGIPIVPSLICSSPHTLMRPIAFFNPYILWQMGYIPSKLSTIFLSTQYLLQSFIFTMNDHAVFIQMMRRQYSPDMTGWIFPQGAFPHRCLLTDISCETDSKRHDAVQVTVRTPISSPSVFGRLASSTAHVLAL